MFERRYGTRIGVVPYGVSDPGPDVAPAPVTRCCRRARPRAAPLHPVRRAARAREQPAPAGRGVLADRPPPGARHEAGDRRWARRTPTTTSARCAARADPRVVFPGYVFGPGYWELQRNAYLFCAPTEVGGTHPVILEAMAAGNCVLVNDHPPNAETVGDAGIYFSGRGGVDDLTRAARPPARRRAARRRPSATGAAARRALLLGGRHRSLRAAAHRGVRAPASRLAARPR